ncbi:hypothetical protein MNB_SUP05-5-176 [hydrothermal vent metagenome]|uniref:Lipoprotein n=1 Tax=hydrothermal vent metagenome TaxID=652676 RepID=A0A1W1BJ81_9ZZZZ
MKKLLLLLPFLLSGCIGTAIDATASAITSTIEVGTTVIKSAVDIVTPDSDDDKD